MMMVFKVTSLVGSIVTAGAVQIGASAIAPATATAGRAGNVHSKEFIRQLVTFSLYNRTSRGLPPQFRREFKIQPMWRPQTYEIFKQWLTTRADVPVLPNLTARQRYGLYLANVMMEISELDFATQSGGKSGDAVYNLGRVMVKFHVMKNGKHEELEFFQRLMLDDPTDKDRKDVDHPAEKSSMCFSSCSPKPLTLPEICRKHPVVSAPIAAFVVTNSTTKQQHFITVMPNAGHQSSPLKFHVTKYKFRHQSPSTGRFNGTTQIFFHRRQNPSKTVP